MQFTKKTIFKPGKMLIAASLALGTFVFAGCAAAVPESKDSQGDASQSASGNESQTESSKDNSQSKELVIRSCPMQFQAVQFYYVLDCDPDTDEIRTLRIVTDFASHAKEMNEEEKQIHANVLPYFAKDVFPNLDKDKAASLIQSNDNGEYVLEFDYPQAAQTYGNEAGTTFEQFKSWFDGRGYLTDYSCS